MNDEFQQRLAANEDVVRRVNEGIERGHWPFESDSPIGFRCECAQVGCNLLLALTPRDYERVRSDPRRFVMLRGHAISAVERVVETLGEIVIVEKLGAAGSEAAARDPRDSSSASRRARQGP